jgi:hypothetical protein
MHGTTIKIVYWTFNSSLPIWYILCLVRMEPDTLQQMSRASTFHRTLEVRLMGKRSVKICDVEVFGKSGTESRRKQNLSHTYSNVRTFITYAEECLQRRETSCLSSPSLLQKTLSQNTQDCLSLCFHCVVLQIYSKVAHDELNQIPAVA